MALASSTKRAFSASVSCSVAIPGTTHTPCVSRVCRMASVSSAAASSRHSGTVTTFLQRAGGASRTPEWPQCTVVEYQSTRSPSFALTLTNRSTTLSAGTLTEWLSLSTFQLSSSGHLCDPTQKAKVSSPSDEQSVRYRLLWMVRSLPCANALGMRRCEVLTLDADGARWYPIAPMHEPRRGFACAAMGECVIVAGGEGSTTSEVYEEGLGRWSRLPCCILHNGQLLRMGSALM
mmetsp:Transcript_13956/g.22858  ORF Transcript_13956/g.22858 Transcript_13956/m.22858 type:complete len:234 (-) Transcript_13956:216-917(-)